LAVDESGHRGHWSNTPDIFDNDFYANLLNPTWEHEEVDGVTITEDQFKRVDEPDPHGGTIMLPSDLSLGWCTLDATCDICLPDFAGPPEFSGQKCDVLHSCDQQPTSSCPPRVHIFGNGILAQFLQDEQFWFDTFSAAYQQLMNNGLVLLDAN